MDPLTANPDPGRTRLTFWGVRGSVPTPRRSHLTYGGNTACLELEIPSGARYLFDAGTGIQNSLPIPGADVTLFLTHFHWDHIQGLPFYAPLFEAGRSIRFFSSRFTAPLRESLAGQMRPPYFPAALERVASRCEFEELDEKGFRSGSLEVRPFRLRHPQGCSGYRMESQGAVIAYVTDHERGDPETDAEVLEQARGADLLIFDAQYTPEELTAYGGRGHSSWRDAAEVAAQAGVRQLVLYHHDPDRDDQAVERLTSQARTVFANTEAAREGWTVTL